MKTLNLKIEKSDEQVAEAALRKNVESISAVWRYMEAGNPSLEGEVGEIGNAWINPLTGQIEMDPKTGLPVQEITTVAEAKVFLRMLADRGVKLDYLAVHNGTSHVVDYTGLDLDRTKDISDARQEPKSGEDLNQMVLNY